MRRPERPSYGMARHNLRCKKEKDFPAPIFLPHKTFRLFSVFGGSHFVQFMPKLYYD